MLLKYNTILYANYITLNTPFGHNNKKQATRKEKMDKKILIASIAAIATIAAAVITVSFQHSTPTVEQNASNGGVNINDNSNTTVVSGNITGNNNNQIIGNTNTTVTISSPSDSQETAGH